jgi:hypothetical protein
MNKHVTRNLLDLIGLKTGISRDGVLWLTRDREAGALMGEVPFMKGAD